MSKDNPLEKLDEIYGHLSNKDDKTINEAMNALHTIKITDDDKKKNKGKETKNTYKVKQAHVVLAEKEKKRDKNVTVQIGDRISYVMVNGMKGSQNYDNA